MDSRQPPLGGPFARNAGSPPYGRSPFPGSASSSTPTASPYPTATHPPSHPSSASPTASGPLGGPPTSAAYDPHQHRRGPSDPQYYPQQHAPSRPPYGPEPPHPAQTHSRHQSSSSIGGMSRHMAPPSPPQQQQQQNPGPQHHSPYGASTSSRPAPNLGPTSVPPGRELPSLNMLQRTGAAGGSMSISAMLGAGGGLPAVREPTPGSSSTHGAFPPPPTSSAAPGPGSAYTSSVHASPRTQNADYYGRRPQTPPEHTRPFDARDGRDPRDQRGSAAGSPPQPMYGTPELARYGPSQAYGSRGPPLGTGPEDRRDQPGRPPMAAVPPRPSSQPRAYGAGPPGRGPPPSEIYGRREEGRPGQGPPGYNPERAHEEQRRLAERERDLRERMEMERLAEFRDRERYGSERARFDDQQRGPYVVHRFENDPRLARERLERDDFELRDSDRRARALSDTSRTQRPGDYGPQGPPLGPPYGRLDPRDPRDPRDGRDPRDAAWPPHGPRPGLERGPYEHSYPGTRPGEYPATSAPAYAGYPAQSQPPADRFTSAPNPAHAIPATQAGPPPYESPERHRFAALSHGTPQRGRLGEEGIPSLAAYHGGPGSIFEGRPRPLEEAHAPGLVRQPSGGLLGVHENRKGRISPLPQAVQGAQPQHQGPADGPGIKSEFGRMFAGIGSGAIGLGMFSPVPPGAALPFSGPRREETEMIAPEPAEPVKQVRKRRKKADDEAKGGDDDSSGRLTPMGRNKRAKTHAHHHHHHNHHHHHHHHQHGTERTSSPLLAGSTPLKNVKSGTPGLSPTVAAKDFPTTHSHSIPRSSAAAKPVVVPAVPAPQPKKKVASQAVLDSISQKPREHLGDIMYGVDLKPAKLSSDHRSQFGYTSNPRPIPMKLIQDKENSILTVKVPRVHLQPAARQEITARRFLWGADVYTDDSDVVAACIHDGWIRGEWDPQDVLTGHLGIDPDEGHSKSKGRNATKASPNGKVVAADANSQTVLKVKPEFPVHVPRNRDMHVDILIVPRLEKYASLTRRGMTSREWGGTFHGKRSQHDGLSYMIWEVRWVDGAAPQSRLRGQGRRERMRAAQGLHHNAKLIDLPVKTPLAVAKTTTDGGKHTKGGENGEGNKENLPTAAPVQTENGETEKPAAVAEVRESSGDAEPVKAQDEVSAAAA